MKRRIPAELRDLVHDDWSNILTLKIDDADQEVLIRELWYVDESGRVMHPRLQGTPSDWRGNDNDLPARRYPILPHVIQSDSLVMDRFNREEFEANPDSSDSDNEISLPQPSNTNHVTMNDEQSSSDSENDDSKNSTSNHVMAMLNRVQSPIGSHDDSEYDSDQSRDEDSPLHTPRSDALIRFSNLRKIVANTPSSVHVKTKFGVTPLLAAVLVDDVQAVKLFLAHQADPDAPDHEGRSPVWWAARLGFGDVLRALLESGATVHTPLSPPVLHVAVLSQQLSAVTALLAHKAVVLAAVDVKGRSALHCESRGLRFFRFNFYI